MPGSKEYKAQWYLANKDRLKKRNAEYYQLHREKIIDQAKLWAKQNPQRANDKAKKWHKENAAQYKAYQKIWGRSAKGIAKVRRRQLTQLQRMPKWLNQDQLNEITSYYTIAKELSWLSESPLEVDHIIPLRGENVSGLHVPWNLQILPKTMNSKKGNKHGST